MLIDAFGLPRYWSTIWADVLLPGIDASTRGAHLAGVERFYRSVAEQTGTDSLDLIIAGADFDALEDALGGFLAKLRNEAAVQVVGREQTWKSTIRFVHDVMSHLGRANGRRISEITDRLARLDQLYGQLVPRPPRAPRLIRALPAVVVEDLYEIFDPASSRNPFRTRSSKCRNQLIYLILLHLGLRQGEALILPADAIKEEYDPVVGKVRIWANIDGTPYEDVDPRSSAPGLKTEYSRRQIPVSQAIYTLTHSYVANYRGRPRHSFLFNSQKMAPMAKQTLADVFSTATDALPARSRDALRNRGKDSVTPHDLRHTSAVHRIARYIAAGRDLDKATELMRVFFGWAPSSPMPLHYARAYFETGLAEIWEEDFDSFVDTLRGIEGKHQT